MDPDLEDASNKSRNVWWIPVSLLIVGAIIFGATGFIGAEYDLMNRVKGAGGVLLGIGFIAAWVVSGRIKQSVEPTSDEWKTAQTVRTGLKTLLIFGLIIGVLMVIGQLALMSALSDSS